MNEVIKEFPLGWQLPLLGRRFFTKSFIANLLVVAIVLSSAFAIVLEKAASRQLFMDVEQLQTERDKIETEWGRLLLEEGALGAQARIQRIARVDFGLAEPRIKHVILVRK